MPTSPAPFVADAARALAAAGCAFSAVGVQEDMPPGSVGDEVPPEEPAVWCEQAEPQRGECARR
jgi:hypothetical protein